MNLYYDKVGRPRKDINWQRFSELRNDGKTIKEAAVLLRVSYKTLRTRIKEQQQRR